MEWWAVLTLVVVGPWIFYGLVFLPLGAFWLLRSRGEESTVGVTRRLAHRLSPVRFGHLHGLVHLHSH
jgi:hypothetical protein